MWLRSWLGIPHGETPQVTIETKVTMISKVSFGIPNQLIPSIKTHVGLHVMYLLWIPDLNQNWSVSTNFRKIPRSAVLELLLADRQTWRN
jgi:hypothetical protein